MQPGDTLFGIAKRHGVQVGALIEVNGLQNGTPSSRDSDWHCPQVPRRRAPMTQAPGASRPATQPIRNRSDGRHRYARLGRPLHPEPGNSLYAVARQHRTTLADLQRANGITDATKVAPARY